MEALDIITDQVNQLALSAPSQNSPASWASLPNEIRDQILENCTGYPGWSSLAAVCKKWQFFVERRNFRRLKLDMDGIDHLYFRRIDMRQRQQYVEDIKINIRLPWYVMLDAEPTRGVIECQIAQQSLKEIAVRTAVEKIFTILCTWTPGRPLKLELNAYCRTDAEFWYKGWYYGSPDERDLADDAVFHAVLPDAPVGEKGGEEEWQEDEDCCQDYGYGYADDATLWNRSQAWFNGQKVSTPSLRTMMLAFEPLNLGLTLETLPAVEAITSFTIRRQLRRCICPESLKVIFARLPRVKSIVYELWRGYPLPPERLEHEMTTMISACNPQTTKSLTIFLDFHYNCLADAHFERYFLNWEQVRHYRQGHVWVAAALASKSLALTHLSVTFMTKAGLFFGNCRSSWIWPNLQTLALTAPCLIRSCKKGSEMIREILCTAAEFALRMPELRLMVLWYVAYGRACAFIYRGKNSRPSITWRATKKLDLQSKYYAEVVKRWQRVASDCGPVGLQVNTERLPGHGRIRCHGDAIHLLNLPVQVVDPVSLRQMRLEGRMGR